MNHFFHKPHPFIFNRSSLLIPFVITFLVVLVLRPFEFSEVSLPYILLWALFFGLIASTCVWLVVWVLQKFTSHALLEDHWTVGKEILLILTVLLCIMLVIFAFILSMNPEANRLKLLGFVLLRTLLISLFPVLILVLYEQYSYQKVKRQEAQQLNQAMKKGLLAQASNTMASPGDTLKEKIHLTAENQKTALSLAPAHLLFVRSEGNYVEVFYLRKDALHKELIRAKLTSIEEQLPGSDFFRCHKSFLINLRHILKVEGNARNLELVMDHYAEKIPVSRSKSKALSAILDQLAR